MIYWVPLGMITGLLPVDQPGPVLPLGGRPAADNDFARIGAAIPFKKHLELGSDRPGRISAEIARKDIADPAGVDGRLDGTEWDAVVEPHVVPIDMVGGCPQIEEILPALERAVVVGAGKRAIIAAAGSVGDDLRKSFVIMPVRRVGELGVAIRDQVGVEKRRSAPPGIENRRSFQRSRL